MSFATWLNWNPYVEFEFANSFANTKFKLELLHTSKHIHQVSTFNHVLEHCTYFVPLIVVCRYRWNQNRKAPPSLKTPIPNLVSKASSPPFDHVDKNPFPSLSL